MCGGQQIGLGNYYSCLREGAAEEQKELFFPYEMEADVSVCEIEGPR